MTELPEDLPPALKHLKELIEEWREEGASDEEIVERFRRAAELKTAEEFGLVERVTMPDGSVEVQERDPFKDLPVTGTEPGEQ